MLGFFLKLTLHLFFQFFNWRAFNLQRHWCFPCHTSSVHGVVVIHAAGLCQRDEQAADGVQRMTHPALQVRR